MTLQRDLFDSAVKLLEAGNVKERLLRANGDEPFPDETWRAIVAAGWALTLVPEDDGGLGLGHVELGAICKAAGRRLCRGPLLDHLVTVPLLLRAASPDLRTRLRRGLDGSGLIVLAEAPAEPWGRGLRAVTLNRGRLHGSIDLVPFGMQATEIVVPAMHGDTPTLVLVDAATVTREPAPSQDPSLALARVRIDRAVSDTDVLAGGQGALDELHATLRLMAGAELSGVAAELVDMSVAHAKVREQFGRPIGGFQALRHVIAKMAQRASSLESLVDAALADADADPSRRVELGMLAKAYGANVGRSVAEDALQVHGGIGFTAEYPLHLYMRRTLTYQGFLGESNELLTHLGESALAG